MRFNQAKKLHNDDEVTDKHTGKVMTVVETKAYSLGDYKHVILTLRTEGGSLTSRLHTEVS